MGNASHGTRVFLSALSLGLCVQVFAARTAPADEMKRYYAHPVVEDAHGVIAPWYGGLNGQCDFRVRIAAETLKRYPWADNPATGLPAPHYLYNGHWRIDEDGTITPLEHRPWHNGDLGQRLAFALQAWLNYYRYSGDPAAIAHVTMIADLIITHCQTGEDHPWPRFPVSVPVEGQTYGDCDPDGMIQLDIAAQLGLGLVRAWQLTGNETWLEHAAHWANVLADHRNRDLRFPPWNRYANPERAAWADLQTGGISLLLEFFDALIELGERGRDDAIVEARDAGLAYLRDVLLPRWTEPDTFGRHYWDWDHPVQGEVTTEVASRYMMAHPERFANWRHDVRNITTMFIHRACTSTSSLGDVYSGAWAYPEEPACCDRSLWYAPMQVGSVLAEYGVRTDSEWAREMARRQFLLLTYDIHPTGVVEDNIDGGAIVADGWFKIAHPMPLRFILDGIAWLPETLGANRENHICRSSAVVRHVVYAPGQIRYETAPVPREQIDVLRLAFVPSRITADGRTLPLRPQLDANGYRIDPLPNGDAIVTIRHDNLCRVLVEGNDPQQVLEDELVFTGHWESEDHPDHFGSSVRATDQAGAEAAFHFEGNQFRIIGAVGPDGGRADVWVDGTKQLCGIDFWNPRVIRQQVLYYVNGLSQGRHQVRVVAHGTGNPRAGGAKIRIEAVQFSAATGDAGFGTGRGPTGRQAWILGYPGREPYVDTKGQPWLPGTEVVVRLPREDDPVTDVWYARRIRQHVAGTDDPELYRYGMHAKELTAYVTAGPGSYRLRLLFMERRRRDAQRRLLDVWVNGQPRLANLDLAQSACTGRPFTWPELPTDKTINLEGMHRAADIVLENVQPRHGVIAVRIAGVNDTEALLAALEVTPEP